MTTTQFLEMLSEVTGRGLLPSPVAGRRRALTAGSKERRRLLGQCGVDLKKIGQPLRQRQGDLAEIVERERERERKAEWEMCYTVMRIQLRNTSNFGYSDHQLL